MVYSGDRFCPLSHLVIIYNTCCLVIQMTLTKNILINLGLNPGQMVRLVPYFKLTVRPFKA